MRTRLARLLRAAADRLDPPWVPAEVWDRAVVPSVDSVEAFAAAMKPLQERVNEMVSSRAEIVRTMGFPAGTAVQWRDPAPRRPVDELTVHLPGRSPFTRRVQRVERDGNATTTHFEPLQP